MQQLLNTKKKIYRKLIPNCMSGWRLLTINLPTIVYPILRKKSTRLTKKNFRVWTLLLASLKSLLLLARCAMLRCAQRSRSNRRAARLCKHRLARTWLSAPLLLCNERRKRGKSLLLRQKAKRQSPEWATVFLAEGVKRNLNAGSPSLDDLEL